MGLGEREGGRSHLGEIERQAKLIAALADTMEERMWAGEILQRCEQIEAALVHIRSAATKRQAGER